ncbi:MAG: GNAT family N-acetyltransferase [Bacteroidota bacterium]|nr:GNAT family N-acetyltransferase [Bacteroidota bacterium]
MKRRIYLEKMQPHDFDAFYAMVSNEKIMARITERALSKEEALKKFNELLRNSALHKSFGSYKVLERTGSKLMGMAKLEITPEKLNEAELGFMLLPEFWGKGYGTEIAKILFDIAKTYPHLKRVYANIDPDNKASRKILINMGFTSEKVGEIDGLPSEIFGMDVSAG